MNNFGYYNRRACQRCHAQKLSCRPETQTECSRCIKANAKCVPRSPLRTRKGNISSEQRSQPSRHGISANDKIEPEASTTELPNFSDEVTGGICMESTTIGTSEESEVNNTNPYSSMVPASQWFTDMLASDIHLTNGPSSLPAGPDDLSYKIEDYAMAPSPVGDGDAAFNSLNYGQFLIAPQELPSISLDVSLAEALSTASRNTSDDFCKKDWVEELARLNSRICSHEFSRNIGNAAYTTPERSRSGSMSTESEKSPIDRPICLDGALTLTKDLIKLLDALSAPDDPPAHNSISQFDDDTFRNVFEDIALGTSIQHLDTTISNKRISIPNMISDDPFTVLLYMSCYIRLIGIYKLIFARIQAEVTQEGTQTASPLWLRAQLPTIVVGPFSMRSNPNLEAMLIVELIRSVIGHIGHAARLMTAGITGDASQDLGRRRMTPMATHSMDHTVVSMLSAVEENEKGLLDVVHGVRDVMMQRYLSPNATFP